MTLPLIFTKNVSFLATDDPDPKRMVNVCMNTVPFIVDCGSTHHLVNKETGKFLEKVEDVNLFIQFAKKGETIVAKHCGNLEAILSDGVHATLKNVYECDGLTRNLLLVLKI